jgi:hypothetical protein
MATSKPKRPRRTALLVIAACVVLDAFVLRTVGTGLEIEAGQFRRGYFERFDDGVGLAIDGAIRPDTVPTFQLLARGAGLGVPPGMIAVAPLRVDIEYRLSGGHGRAPYAVIATVAPVAQVASYFSLEPDEARLTDARTPALRDGALVLLPWSADRPWRDDASRLSALRAACVAHDQPATMTVSITDESLDLRLGRCALSEPRSTASARPPELAALAGPDWLTVGREPDWAAERWVSVALAGVVVAKIAVMWFAVGAAATMAGSVLLAVAAIWMPTPALATWGLSFALVVVAGLLRAVACGLRSVPSAYRVPVMFVGVASRAGLLGSATAMFSERTFPPIQSDHDADWPCAVIGYSTVAGQGLRHGFGGVRRFLDTDCTPCRRHTASLSAGGETLAWARDAYCTSAESFGAAGDVVFLGGVNDDFFWEKASIPRFFIAAQQGPDSWQRNVASAAALSAQRIGAQVGALQSLIQCASDRRAAFVFVHDFLVTDLPAGRDVDRALMLSRRKAVVQEAGGTFVDLRADFEGEAGVAWFNDDVHLSSIGHRRAAEATCRFFR